MKLILILFIFYSIKSVASNSYYIVADTVGGKPVVVGSSHAPINYLYKAPKDDDGVFVRTIRDMSLVKFNTVPCLDSSDCNQKSSGICDGIANSRIIIVADFTETYCASPRFSASKRATRLAQIETEAGDEKTKRELIDANLDQIKLGCPAAVGLLKLMCNHMSRNR